MQKFISVLTLIFGLLATLLVVSLGYGLLTGALNNDAGMAVLAFKLYGTIFSISALMFGFIGIMIARSKKTLWPRLSKIGFCLGAISTLSIFVMNLTG